VKLEKERVARERSKRNDRHKRHTITARSRDAGFERDCTQLYRHPIVTETYVFSLPQSASSNPFCDVSRDQFQIADFKQLRLMILFSYLTQVVGPRAFIGQNQHQASNFGGRNTYPKA